MSNPTNPPTAPMQLSQMIVGLWVPQVVHAAAELGIADALAAGPLPARAIAERLGTHPDATERLLLGMATIGLVTAGADGFELTALGRCLETEHPTSRRAWAQVMGGTKVWAAWGQLVDCVRSGRPVVADAFEGMAEDPAGAAVFHRAMLELTRTTAPAIVGMLDVANVERVCDVGGGSGALLCAVLEAHPALSGAVFDLENARTGAVEQFASRGLGARASFVAGSFFDAAPPRADLYLVKSVIHDWDDERALRILRGCRDAMTAGARLVLVEPAAPVARTGGPGEWIVTFSDLNMLINTGGRERTAAEYRALLEAAGLRLTAVRETPAYYCLFEARRA